MLESIIISTLAGSIICTALLIFKNKLLSLLGGKALVKQYRLDSTGKVSLIFYSCPSDSRGKQTHCLFKKIYEEELAEIVYKSLQLYVCMAAKNKKELLDIKPRPLREFDEDITRYTHIIENIEVLRTNIFDDFGSGKISGIEYKAIVEGYKEKQERYKLLLEDLKVKREKYLTDRLERQSWVKKLLKFEKDTQLTREMVDELIERINLSGHNKIEICYKFKNLFEDVLLNGGVCIG